MKTSLDHIPNRQQRELDRIVETLHSELSEVLALGSTNWKRQGRIVKIESIGIKVREVPQEC